MKQVLIIILIAFSLNTYSQKNEIDLSGSWLAVNTIGYKTNGYSIKNGYIIELNNDSLTFGHIFYDSKKSFSYIILDSSILLADSIRIDIDQITQDSIKLIFDNESLVTFLKLPFTKPQLFKIDTLALINNSWIYSDSNYIQRIEFLNQEWEHHDDDAFNCYTHPVENNEYFDFSSNKWRVFNNNGNTYLARTFEQHYGILHEIINLTKDSITTKAWIGTSFRNPLLTKINSIPELSIYKIKNILSRKIWNVKNIKYESSSLGKWDKKITSEHVDIAYNKKMKFSFAQDSLRIFNNDSTLINIRWDLTNDGKYITLNYKNYTSYIEIIETNDDFIIIKNNIDFTYLIGLLNITDNIFEITLE